MYDIGIRGTKDIEVFSEILLIFNSHRHFKRVIQRQY